MSECELFVAEKNEVCAPRNNESSDLAAEIISALKLISVRRLLSEVLQREHSTERAAGHCLSAIFLHKRDGYKAKRNWKVLAESLE